MRSPIEIILVTRNCGGQSHFWAKKIDGASLAIILSKNPAAFLFFGWKLVIRIGYNLRHLFPAELVGIDLRQRAHPVIFNLQRLKMHELRIGNVLVDAEQREISERRQ